MKTKISISIAVGSGAAALGLLYLMAHLHRGVPPGEAHWALGPNIATLIVLVAVCIISAAHAATEEG